MLKTVLTQTEREKSGTLDGINLFFGALLGANLGSLSGLSLPGYAMIVLMLAGTVMALRIFIDSERRGYATSLLLLYVVSVGGMLYAAAGLRGLAVEDRWRLAITVGIWVGSVVLTVLYPTSNTGEIETEREPRQA